MKSHRSSSDDDNSNNNDSSENSRNISDSMIQGVYKGRQFLSET